MGKNSGRAHSLAEALEQELAWHCPGGKGPGNEWTEPWEERGHEGCVAEFCRDFGFRGGQEKVLSRGLTQSDSPAHSGCCVKNRGSQCKSGSGEND